MDTQRNHWSSADIAATAGSALLLAWFLTSPQAEWYPLKDAAAISLGFAVLAFLLKGVSLGGAITGGISAFLFYAIGRLLLFELLLVVFLVTFVATKICSRKLGRKSVPRTAIQVAANLAVPAFILAWTVQSSYRVLPLPLVLASLAELTADTVSSEIGESYGKATYLITTFKEVERGVNGGMSLMGTLAGSAAALFVIGAAMLSFYPLMPAVLHFCGWRCFWTAVLGGIAGMFVDSLLGSTLEKRGWINNEAVNFIGTASAAGTAWCLLRLSS